MTLKPLNLTFFSNHVKSSTAILKAMMQNSVRRYIGMHSWYTEAPTRQKAAFFLRWTLIPYIAPVLDDMRNVEKLVESEMTEIDYTFVLPPGLQNKPVTGRDLEAFAGEAFAGEAFAGKEKQKVCVFPK